MAFDWTKERGTPLDEQRFDWREIAPAPYSKLDDDAFTRVRVILMNGIEAEQLRFLHAAARNDARLQLPLAQVRRVEQHQQTLVNWLNPGDQSALETTIGFEQVAIEVTAEIAQREPDPYAAQVYRFGLLEDFDHLYRFAALMDRVHGMDANNILQSHTDIRPGRPTSVEHRAPTDDLRRPVQNGADPRSVIYAHTIVAGENMTHDYYMVVGPQFADPVARQLYAEIASIEEQHVTQYECLLDPGETLLSKWLMHEATEVWNYHSCAEREPNARIKAIWERFVDYELGHLHFVADLVREHEKRDPFELLPAEIPDPLEYTSQRRFVREVLDREVDFRAVGEEIGALADSQETREYREQMNSAGSPSEIIAAGYRWAPGTELVTKINERRRQGRRQEVRPS